MKQLPLTGKYGTGKFVSVNDEDYDTLSVHAWRVAKNGYVCRTLNLGRRDGKKQTKGIFMHRLITGAETEHVHHKNHDRLDNCRENLQLVTQQQNNYSTVMHKRNKVGYKGVYIRKVCTSRPYGACIAKDGKKYYLGYFPTAIEAAQAYNTKALELHGDFAMLNDLPTRTLAT